MYLSSATPFTRRVSLRALVLGTAASLLLLSSFFALRAIAQEKGPAASPKQPAKLAHPAQSAPSEQQSKNKLTTALPQHEGAEQLRKREEWFYKQRADPRGHIPAGARLKAFQHMQRMMEAEGKLVRRADGSFAAVVPEAGPAVGGTWSPLGPAPTTGGFFSPVSGRIEAIAVDPSDSTGNTVLVGGAQGGIWRSTDAGATWTAVGDGNASLAMGSIAFAPSSPATVYAGTGEQADLGFDIYYGAGVLKSTDHGVTWTQTCTTASSTCPFIGPFTNTLNFGFFNDGGARISYIAVNPSNPQLVLVGAQIPLFGSQSERAGGIFCSDNGGITWTALLSGEAGSFVGFASSSVAYAALGRSLGTATGAPNPNGIYKSTNANGSSCSAITFSPVTGTGLPAQSSMGRIDLGIAASDTTGNTLYASVANGGTNPSTGRPDGSRHNLGVFVTSNGGSTWTQTGAPDICQRQCWYDNVVKVDPSKKDIVFLGGGAVTSSTAFEWVMRSTNGTIGGTFSPAIPTPSNPGDPTLPHVDQHAMAFVKLPSTGKVRLYLGNDGGLWRTDDAEAPTVSWQNLNQSSPAASGLTLTQFYPNVSVNPSNQNIAYGGAQDNGSQVFQGVPNWMDNQQCGDGGQTAVDFQVPTSVYVDCQGISLSFSPTGGTDPNSYAPAGNGIDPNGTDNVDFIAPIATDPSTAGRVYFGTDHVYQSSDNGTNFTAISGALAATFNTSNGPVHFALTALAVSPLTPSNTSVVYAGAEDGEVFVATNVATGTATFNRVGGQSNLPGRNVTALTVDPSDPTGMTAYATFSGFAITGSDTLGHVFKTTNGGTLWTDVSCSVANCATPNQTTDLPNIPVNDLVVDPDVPGTIYAATDIGAFQGTCTVAGCTWNTLGSALPNVAVLSLKLHEPSRTLVAGTHGRGAWSLSVPLTGGFVGPHVSSISPISITAGAASAAITVNGTAFAPGGTPGAVNWDGSATGVTTQAGGTDTQLQATIAASLLSSGGTHRITVVANAQTSNSLIFGVIAGAPTISSVVPTSAPVNTN